MPVLSMPSGLIYGHRPAGEPEAEPKAGPFCVIDLDHAAAVPKATWMRWWGDLRRMFAHMCRLSAGDTGKE